MADERRVHPDCINASNPYHECVEYCFIKIAEAKAQMEKENPGITCYPFGPSRNKKFLGLLPIWAT